MHILSEAEGLRIHGISTFWQKESGSKSLSPTYARIRRMLCELTQKLQEYRPVPTLHGALLG